MYLSWLTICLFGVIVEASAQSTQGIVGLVKRRLPSHVDDFTFQLTVNRTVPAISSTNATNDEYVISSTGAGKIHVEGNSPIALASG